MARKTIQAINPNTLLFFVMQNEAKIAVIFATDEELLTKYEEKDPTALEAKLKKFFKTMSSGSVVKIILKTSGNSEDFYTYHVAIENMVDHDFTAQKVDVIDPKKIEKEIRERIAFEEKCEEVERLRKELTEKNAMIETISGKAHAIVENVGGKILNGLISKYAPQIFGGGGSPGGGSSEEIVNGEEITALDSLFTKEEQNLVGEILKTNEMYLGFVRNLIKEAKESV